MPSGGIGFAASSTKSKGAGCLESGSEGSPVAVAAAGGRLGASVVSGEPIMRTLRLLSLPLVALLLLVAAPAPARGQDGDARARVAALEREILGLFAAGKYEAAAEKCREEIALVPTSPAPRYNLACALARVGESEAALDALAKAVELGYDDADHMTEDPDLESIRGEERFAAILGKAKAANAAALAKLYEPPAEVAGVKTVEGDPEGGLRWRLRLPEDASKERPARLLVWLHPSGGSMNRVVEALSPQFAERGFALLVATQKRWMGWSEDDAKRLIGRTLPDVSAREDVDGERPVLLGFSAGGQMALTLYDRDPGRYGGLILDAAYPIDMEAYRQRRMEATKPPADAAVKEVPILVLVGDRDGGVRIWDLADADWRAAGVPLTIDRVPGGKHEWLARGEHLTKLLDWLAAVAAGDLPGRPAPKEVPEDAPKDTPKKE